MLLLLQRLCCLCTLVLPCAWSASWRQVCPDPVTGLSANPALGLVVAWSARAWWTSQDHGRTWSSPLPLALLPGQDPQVQLVRALPVGHNIALLTQDGRCRVQSQTGLSEPFPRQIFSRAWLGGDGALYLESATGLQVLSSQGSTASHPGLRLLLPHAQGVVAQRGSQGLVVQGAQLGQLLQLPANGITRISTEVSSPGSDVAISVDGQEWAVLDGAVVNIGTVGGGALFTWTAAGAKRGHFILGSYQGQRRIWRFERQTLATDAYLSTNLPQNIEAMTSAGIDPVSRQTIILVGGPEGIAASGSGGELNW